MSVEPPAETPSPAPGAAKAAPAAEEPQSQRDETPSSPPVPAADPLSAALDELDKIAIPDAVAPLPKGLSFDQVLEENADAMTEALDGRLVEPSRPAPAPSEPGQVGLYPEDEEFFFDYIDYRDLK